MRSLRKRRDVESGRQKPLPSCPSLRCRRAKACLAAHDNLYCQRTHFSPAVAEKWLRRDPRRRELDAVPPVMDPDSLSERMERINELRTLPQAVDEDIVEEPLRLRQTDRGDIASGMLAAVHLISHD